MTELHWFAREVKAGLARKEMSRSQLADALGTSEPTLSRWLRSDTTWPLDKAIKAAQMLGIDLSLIGSQAVA